jgi:HEPN superfamily AbiV-like protein
MPASVSPRYLLEGAAHALEQCGLLLRDANLLYRSSSYASAVALAAFAQEELGRWKMLHDLRRKVLGGDSVTIKEIQTRCGDHVRKQEAGVMSVGVVGRHRHLHLRSIRWCPDRDPIGRPPMGFPEGVATSERFRAQNDCAALDDAEGGASHLQEGLAADDNGRSRPRFYGRTRSPASMSGSSTVMKPSRCKHSRTASVVASNSPFSL